MKLLLLLLLANINSLMDRTAVQMEHNDCNDHYTIFGSISSFEKLENLKIYSEVKHLQ